ncbi:DUF6519 domain-containing protein [Actinopolymorpha sp. B11F2]|uniref:DUF6519 domain-containing protein n=1 Tax=Actinopolymorpha sp. B11F2 TaxID=3160862 RepID=UPI0032E47507
MQGDFSRWTFDPREGYRSVLLQQGRVLLDADWNEQVELTAYHDETRTRDIVGRTGGPAADAGFGIVDSAGGTPSGTTWTDLRITPGRYYVDGILCDAGLGGTGSPGVPLTDQPYLAAIGSSAGLSEPSTTAGARYALYLDVWTHHVTADEEPSLREPALGGPDTTTRARTVWQVRAVEISGSLQCSDLNDPTWLQVTRGTMTPSLRQAAPDEDPCRITTSGGYTRLENQLYRVQIHDEQGGTPRYLWSRENGSVVAGLTAIETTVATGMDAELRLDRVGRDDELSIREGDTVEVTSTDRQLRGLPGHLATVGVPDGLRLPVVWTDGAPASRAALGRAPIVRRWEGPTRVANTSPDDLEGGIRVAFDGGGAYRTGDYWLVPARTVRLAYGLTALSGTLDWPTDADGDPVPARPLGPVHHVAPLAVVERTSSGWTRVSDCRRFAPSLTDLVTLDLVGGDGQESLPGTPLPEPVRVVARNGGLPVVGARVRFTAQSGTVADATGSGSQRDVPTGPDGVAAVRWTLSNATGAASTQRLVMQRLDDHGVGTGVQVIVTGRRSVASQVAWTPVCDGFAGTTTVQDALGQLATTVELRLQGGDGQYLPPNRKVLPEPVRVIVDSPCGPVKGVEVTAEATDGALVAPAKPGEASPDTLEGAGGEVRLTAGSGDDGGVALWWQPSFSGGASSDSLTIRVADDADRAPVIVTAQRPPSGRGDAPGVHVAGLELLGNREFVNDDVIKAAELAEGITVRLDGPVAQDSVRGKPVVRVVLDLPWPLPGELESVWPDLKPVGFRPIELDAEWNADNDLIVWTPSGATAQWLVERLFDGLRRSAGWERPLIGRFVLDGWAIVGERDPDLHLNGHVVTALDGNGRTEYLLPSDDAVTGGPFVQWFRLTE